MNLIILGPPGAGKGTQAKRLESVLELPHIATGDIFRDISRSDPARAKELQSYMDHGQNVPDDLTIDIVLARLGQPDAQRGFILDGFPRTEPQAEALDRALTEQQRGLDTALYITIPNELVGARTSGRLICPHCHAIYNEVTQRPRQDTICDRCGHTLERRTDESPEVVEKRIAAYRDQTKPLVEYYRSRGILSEINGAQLVSSVNHDVDAALSVRGAW